MCRLRIKSAGLLTTVQDRGRSHLQHLGVPGCGAMDRLSLAVANILVGNPRDAAVLECTWSGPVIEFTQATSIALAGAVTEAKLNGYRVPMYTTLFINDGDVLDLTRITHGARLYVAVSGGIDVPVVLGSRSTYLAVQFGEMDHRLKANDVLPLVRKARPFRALQIDSESDLRIKAPHEQAVIRVVDGPQIDYFSSETRNRLVTTTYTLSNQSDRMGMRFDGPSLKPDNSTPLISDGIAFGSMQITRGGQPIVMMADRQPTGGYPKIAKVILSDLSALAQLRPGDQVQFKWVTLDESRNSYLANESLLQKLEKRWQEQQPASRVFNTYVNHQLFQIGVTELIDPT